MSLRPESDAASQPSAWVARFAQLIPDGEVLDLACGNGRHSYLLAALGHQVLVVDRNPEALARLSGDHVHTELFDLEFDPQRTAQQLLTVARFSGIVVTNYLHRPLLPVLLSSLKPGGLLIYQTFMRGNEKLGKPSNPEFLLESQELLDLVRNTSGAPSRVVAFEEGRIELPKPAWVQSICAERLAD